MYGMHLRARRRRQGKRRGVNDDGEALKGEVKDLSGDREALKDDGSIEGQWRGTAYAYNCDGKAVKFDGEALSIDGEVLSLWEPVPDKFGIWDCTPRTSPRYIRD